MPYRQGRMAAAGDYYRGAAQGDLFGFIGKAIKGIAGVAGSVLPGPLGVIGRAISGIGAAKQNPIGATLPPPVIGIRSLGGGGTLPVIKPDSTVGRGVNLGPLNIGSSTTYYSATDGTIKKRHRRMNVTNVKALRRAGRRVKGFEKLARRFIGFAAPHKPKGRMYFKSRKRA